MISIVNAECLSNEATNPDWAANFTIVSIILYIGIYMVQLYAEELHNCFTETWNQRFAKEHDQ